MIYRTAGQAAAFSSSDKRDGGGYGRIGARGGVWQRPCLQTHAGRQEAEGRLRKAQRTAAVQDGHVRRLLAVPLFAPSSARPAGGSTSRRHALPSWSALRARPCPSQPAADATRATLYFLHASL